MNKDVAELANNAGPAAALFYTWLLAHLDVEGKQHGDALVLKGMVCPRLQAITPELIEETLQAATKLGLLEWYEVDGERYVYFPNFLNNQPGLRKEKEAKSTFPNPKDGQTPSLLPTKDGPTTALLRDKDKDKGKDKDQGEVKETPTSKTPRRKKDDSAKFSTRVACVYDHYLGYHPEAELPDKLPSTAKEYRLIKARLKEGMTVDALKLAIDGYQSCKWHQGINSTGEKWDSLELYMRDMSHVQKGIGKAKQADKPNPVAGLDAKGVRSVSAAFEFVNEAENAR